MDNFWTERIETELMYHNQSLLFKVHVSDEIYYKENTFLREMLTNDQGPRTYVSAKLTSYENEFGRAQAWYYPQDDILVLWECYLNSLIRSGDRPLLDKNLVMAWKQFYDWLAQRFDPRIVTTPSWEPIYETSAWQEFLVLLGFKIEGKMAILERK